MGTMKITTLRLEEGLAKELALIARADEVPVSEAIRAALNRYIAERKADEKVRARFKAMLEEDVALLERLGKAA
jgi:metal-responsive CopG/Arc/MetJ family transcriptional regulator